MSIIGLVNIAYGIYLIRTVLFVYQSEVCTVSFGLCTFFNRISFYWYRVIWKRNRLKHTIDFSCIYGHQIHPYRLRQATNDFMTQWIKHSNHEILSNKKNDYDNDEHTEVEKKIIAREVIGFTLCIVATPIKFSFHTWLNHNLLSTRLHTQIYRIKCRILSKEKKRFFPSCKKHSITMHGFINSIEPTTKSIFVQIHSLARLLAHSIMYDNFFFLSIFAQYLVQCVCYLVFFRTLSEWKFFSFLFSHSHKKITNPLIYCRLMRSLQIHSFIYGHA